MTNFLVYLGQFEGMFLNNSIRTEEKEEKDDGREGHEDGREGGGRDDQMSRLRPETAGE